MKYQRAFTLLEFLFLIVILTVLAIIITTAISSSQKRTRDAQRANSLKVLETSIRIYREENGAPPKVPIGCTNGLVPTSSGEVDALAIGVCFDPDWILGIVPTYLSVLPADPGPKLFGASGPDLGKNLRGFVYMSDGTDYKLMLNQPEIPKNQGLHKIWDPARDGVHGTTDCPMNNNDLTTVDCSNPTAWSYYSEGAAIW